MTDTNDLEKATALVRELESELIELLKIRPSHGKLSLILSFHNSELRHIAKKWKETKALKARKARVVIKSPANRERTP